jgi:hypothetical protein
VNIYDTKIMAAFEAVAKIEPGKYVSIQMDVTGIGKGEPRVTFSAYHATRGWSKQYSYDHPMLAVQELANRFENPLLREAKELRQRAIELESHARTQALLVGDKEGAER